MSFFPKVWCCFWNVFFQEVKPVKPHFRLTKNSRSWDSRCLQWSWWFFGQLLGFCKNDLGDMYILYIYIYHITHIYIPIMPLIFAQFLLKHRYFTHFSNRSNNPTELQTTSSSNFLIFMSFSSKVSCVQDGSKTLLVWDGLPSYVVVSPTLLKNMR